MTPRSRSRGPRSVRERRAERGRRRSATTHRFTARAIETGVEGVFRVLGHLGMMDALPAGGRATPVESRKTRWIRAGRSGICRLSVDVGARVSKGDRVGEISDTFGREPHPVTIRHGGVVIGVRINPLVYKGEALIHLAEPVEEDGGEVGAG